MFKKVGKGAKNKDEKKAVVIATPNRDEIKKKKEMMAVERATVLTSRRGGVLTRASGIIVQRKS